MDDWDAVAKGPKLLSDNVPRCDLTPREALHRIGSLYYISQFKRSKEGMTFREIKSSADHAAMFAEIACKFLTSFIGNTEDWCIIHSPGDDFETIPTSFEREGGSYRHKKRHSG